MSDSNESGFLVRKTVRSPLATRLSPPRTWTAACQQRAGLPGCSRLPRPLCRSFSEEGFGEEKKSEDVGKSVFTVCSGHRRVLSLWSLV